MRKSLVLLLLSCLVFYGCRTGYYSEEDFGSVTKIDSHVHINGNSGYFEETAAGDNFILITLGVDNGDSASISSQHESARYSTVKHPGRVFFGPTFLFDTVGWGTPAWSSKVISALERDLSHGGITVKIWKNIGMTVRDRSGKFIMVDDPGLDPVIEYIKGRGLPVTGHLGEPRNCWLPLDQMTVSSDSSYFARNSRYHMFLHPEYPSYEDQINARDNMLAKHPDLTFIGCHLASLEWNVDSLALRLDRFPNMAVDMSARICHLQYQSAVDRKKVRDFCIKYQDRLLYGTDVGDSGNSDPVSFREGMHATWLDDWKYLTSDDEMTSDKFRGSFIGLKLPKDVVDKIYFTNAVNWYKLKL
ncbi:MAG TPA: amidohydrolase family protein [Bacteroidales bacterium]|nr:amidohydrolase family protein [Bacteroidales bacterium]